MRFKRAFHVSERDKVFSNVRQIRPYAFDYFAEDGVMPLGHFPTEEGYILVFPNCHIHKVAKMINQSANGSDVTRKIIVFFVVNPEKRIISTADIPPQQDKIPLEKAKQYRLNLMGERKYDKEKFNTRDIELCEH